MDHQLRKTFLLLIVAAALGSALTWGFVYFSGWTQSQSFRIERVNRTASEGGVYTLNEAGEAVPLDFTAAAARVMPAVVHIKSSQTNYRAGQPGRRDPYRDYFGEDFFERFFGPRFRNEQRQPEVRVGTGSGVVINAEGYIVTNNHVIDMADDIEVTLQDNRTYKATVIGTDPSTDLALIKIEETELKYLPFVDSDSVQVGEWVLAVGNPFNLNSTVTAGIVSAKGRNINILREQAAIESFIQTDAAINPGNSGGALVDLQGNLIGINTAIASPTGAYSGYGFAVPANIVSKVVEDLIAYGVVQRGFLGVLIRDVDGNLAREEGLRVTEGVYVDSLMENSAAAAAGIKAGDVIIEVEGTAVKSAPELQESIGRRRPGDEVQIKVNRDGEELSFTVSLFNREGKAEMLSPERKEISSVLGAELETLDASVARELGIPGGIRVVRLFAGKLQRDTNMQPGFIITKVDGEPVASLDELADALEGKAGGVMLEGVYEDRPGSYYYAFGM